MVTPVNPDKTVSGRADKPLQTNQRMPTGQDHQPKDAAASHATATTETQVDVESARQLYQMENQRPAAAGSRITTQQQARTLLDQILQQFSATPDKTLQAQSPNGTAALANLLQRAPA
jgi:hypothetical protein